MNQAQVDYAALRYTTSKDLSSVANSFKRGGVSVETVYVQRLGKRIMKFRCPPGTRRGGQWTDRLGTDCNLGPARAGLAKITRTVSRIDNALDESEQRVAQGGPGLVRYQSGRALERAGDVVDYAADSVRKRGQATRVRAGQALERAGDRVDDTAARVGRALERAGDRVDEASERLKQAYERVKQRVGVALERAGDAINDWADRRRARKVKPGGITPENDAMARELIRQMQLANLAEWAKNPKSKPSKESKLLLTPDQKKQAAQAVANRIYGAWLASRQGDDGSFEPEMVDDGNGGQINLAATDFSDWPDAWQAEWHATGASAVHAIDMDPDADDDTIAERMHDAWQARHQSWAPDPEQTYDQLGDDDKEYLQSIVAEARGVIDEIINPDDADLEDAPEQGGWIPSDIQSAGFKKPKGKKKPKAAKQGDSEWDDLTQNERNAINYALGNDREDWINNVSQGSPYINDWFGDALASSRQAREDLANATTPYQREMARRRAAYNRRLAEWTLRRSTNPDLGEMKDVLDPASFDMANPDVFGKNGEKFSDFPHQGIDPQLLEVLEKDGLVDPEGDGFDPDLFKPFDGELPEKFVVRPAMDDLQQMAEAADTEAPGEAAAADVPEAEVPSVDKKPIPVDEEGKVPTPKRTVLNVPEDAKKPSGPAKAAGASLNDATAKNAKKTGKKLPGKQYGTTFTNEKSAKKWGHAAALDNEVDVYVAKTPSGKFLLVDEERFKALGYEAAYAFDKNGGLIELEEPSASTSDDIVAEVAHENVLADVAASAELNAPPVPPASLNMKKSKTGAFLPDDFNQSMLTEEQDNAFVVEFFKQRESVKAFWAGQLGKDLEGDPAEMLAEIDGFIATEAAKPDKNAGHLGVLNAERNNFLALTVPQSGASEVDPYERINFVGPKRRSMIIQDANLTDQIVSGKLTKIKNKNLAEASTESLNEVDGQISGEGSASPLPSLFPVDVRKVGALSAVEAFLQSKEEETATYLTENLNEAAATDFEQFRLDGLLKQGLFEDARQSIKDAWQEKRDDVLFRTDNETVTQQDLDELLELERRHRLFEDVLPSHFYDKFYAQQAKEIFTDESMPVLDESLEPLNDAKNVVKASIDAFTSDSDLRDTLSANTRSALMSDFLDLDSDVPSFYTKAEIDAWIDAKVVKAQADGEEAAALLKDLEEYGIAPTVQQLHAAFDKADVVSSFWEERRIDLHKMLGNERPKPDKDTADVALQVSQGDYSNFYVITADGIESTAPGSDSWTELLESAVDGVVYHNGETYLAPDIIATMSAESLDMSAESLDMSAVEPLQEVSTIDVAALEVLGKEMALSSLFESVQGFNFNMLASAEGQKMGNTLATILSRVESKPNYSKKIDDVIANLPDNISELSPEEQLMAIRAAGGGSSMSDLQLAKEIARSTFTNQYGRATSLKELQTSLTNLSAGGAVDAQEDFESQIASAKAALAEAQDQFQKLPLNTPEPMRLLYVGRINDAKARYVAASVNRHVQIKQQGVADLAALSQSYKDMNASIAILDDNFRVAAEKLINDGFAVEAGKVDLLSGKGMIQTAGYDSTIAGTLQPNGKAIAYAIPGGNKGIFTKEDAASHLSTGGKLSDIPDDFLNDAIRQNLGPAKRFRTIAGGPTGYNDTVQLMDTLTGNRYVLKAAHRNHMEHIQEIAGARLAQIVGEPSIGIRFGSALYADPNLPGPRKAEEGVQEGLQRAIVVDAVHNMFKGDGYQVFDSMHDVPSGSEFDGASLARMMVLDRTMNYFDRTGANMIPVKGPDGKIHLHPIDAGNGFRGFEGVGGEQAAGFVKKTKSDNVDLMALVKNLSPEERQRWAETLQDGIKRFKRAEFEKEFGEMADVMKVTQDERERLLKHATFLEGKKESLDWELMARNAMLQAGLDDVAIEEIINPPLPSAAYKRFDSLVVPAETMTIGSPKLGQAIDDMHPGALAKSFTYDGGEIRKFEVRASKVVFSSQKLGVDSVPSTMLEFKRTGSAVNLQPSPENGWTMIRQSHATPDMRDGSKPPEFRPDSGAYLPGSGPTQTWGKKLDDGTVVLVTTGDTKNSADNTVRIIMPGDASINLMDQDRVRAAMEEVGVTHHGLPTQQQLEKFALSAAQRVLTGKNSGLPNGIEKNLEQEWGITRKNLRSVIDSDGALRVEFDDETVGKIVQRSGVKTVYHSLSYGANADTAIFNSMIDGRISSSTRRFNHGVTISGGSTSSDVGTYGSGDYLFAYRNYASTMENLNPSSFSFYTPVEVAYRRTDWYALGKTPSAPNGDHYGNISHNKGIEAGHNGNTAMESMFDGGLDVTKGLIVLPDQTSLANMINRLKAAGVETVNGVPIEDILVTGMNFQEKALLLKQRLASEGINF